MRFVHIFNILCCLTLSLLLEAESAFAEIRVTVSPESGVADDLFQLEATIIGSKNFSKPRFERNSFLSLEASGTTSRQSIINGDISSEYSFTFRIIPNKRLAPGTYQTPKGEIDIDGQTVTIPEAKFQITKTSTENANKTKSIDYAQTVDNAKPYLGEQIIHTTKLATAIDVRDPVWDDFNPPGFWKESFGEAEQSQSRIGASVLVVTLRTALFPIDSGSVEIPARRLDIKAQVPDNRRIPRGRGSVFDQFLFNDMLSMGLRSYRDIVLRTDPVALEVRPLPPAPYKTKHTPVGKLQIDSSVDKSSATVGESLTYTVTISGDANLRPLVLPEFPKEVARDFTVYSDSPELETEVKLDRLHFAKTFKIALVPKHSGKLEIPSLDILSFNPRTEQYEILKTRRVEITVSGNSGITTSTKSIDSDTGVTTASEELLPAAGNDINPLITGTRLLEQKKTLSTATLYSIVLFMPLLYAGCFFYLWRQSKILADPAYYRKKRAYKVAARALSKNPTSLDSVHQVLQKFLQDFFDANNNTSIVELSRTIEQTGDNKDLAEELIEIFRTFENARYGGSQSAEVSVHALTERSMKCMKKIAEVLLVLFCFAFASIQPAYAVDDALQLLQQGEQSYRSGDFKKAEDFFLKTIPRFGDSPELSYNLGNIYFRQKHLGLARAYFWIAHEQLPRDKAVFDNLLLTESNLKITRAPLRATGFFVIRQFLSERELQLGFLVFYTMTWAVMIWRLFTQNKIWLLLILTLSTTYVGTALSLSTLTPSGAYALTAPWEQRQIAVAVDKQLTVRSGDAPHHLAIALIREGMAVEVLQARSGWLQLQLTDGKVGWAEAASLKIIQ